MPVFVVLLRGVNVGRANRIAMADLRAVLTANGFAEVSTYIQSGNIILSATKRDASAVARDVREVLARELALDVPVVALTARELLDVIEANPYAGESDPKRLHAIVLPEPPDAGALHSVAAHAKAAAQGGSRDGVTVIGRIAYLHTPDGFSDSALANVLTAGRTKVLANGTARNWATITALASMVH